MKKVILTCFLVAVLWAQNNISGCVRFSNQTLCSICNEEGGYELNPSENGSKCLCATGFYKEDNGMCVSCAEKFFSCKQCNKDSCTSCVDSIALGSGQQPCINTSCENSSTTTGCTSCSTQCSVCSTDRNFSSIPLPGGQCQCQKGFIKPTLSASYCLPCSHLIPGCISCSSHQTCLICDESLNFEPSPNTQNKCSCKPSMTLFTNTMPYYHRSECFDCSSQIQHCLICASKINCTVCEDGYGYNDLGQCKQCLDVGCVKCSRADNCTVCNLNNNFVSDDSGHCKCSEGFVLNSTKECQACNLSLSGCNSCSGLATCLSCDSSKHFTLNETKNKCQCLPQYYYDPLSTTCPHCSSPLIGCLQCSNSSFCNICNAYNNFIKIESNSKSCSCDLGHYLVQPDQNFCGICRDAIPNCRQCANSTFCVVCDNGYTWKTINLTHLYCARCDSFSFGCLTCQSQKSCTSCNASLNLLLYSTRCQCKAGYFMNSTSQQCQVCTVWSNQCIRCNSKSCTRCTQNYQKNGTSCSFKCAIPLCVTCFNSTVCSTCVPFSSLVDNAEACKCDAGYYSKNNKCVACQIQNCVSCRYGAMCSKCAKGFEMDLEDQCVASVVVVHNYQRRVSYILSVIAAVIAIAL